jgi:ACS family glucarate transporter-like MFS transporter
MPNGTRSNVRWFLIFWLFILSAVAFLDRVNLSIAGNAIMSEFHLTNIQLGYVLSAFLMGYALFQTPGGWLADRLGPRKVLAIGVAWWGIFTALTAVVSPRIAFAVLVFVCIRFLLGAGEAIIYPASNQFVSQWIPTLERGRANGVIFAGVGVGSGATPLLITYIATHFGWRWSFWISSLIGLIVGLAWYLIARDSPEEHPWVSPSELAWIQGGRTSSQASSSAAAPQKALVPWEIILTSGNVWAITLSYFCFGYVAWIFFGWFYIYLAQVRGVNLKSSAIFSTIVFLTMAVCSPLGGAISDALAKSQGKRIARASIAIFALTLACIFLVIGSRSASATLASLVLAGGAGALYLSQSSFWSVTADIAAGSSGSVSGFMNMGAQFGGMVTTSLTPIIAARFGWNASFIVAAVMALTGASLWFVVNPEKGLETEAQL